MKSESGGTATPPAVALVTYRQASEYLGLPIGTLYALVHAKKIDHVRFGPRSVRFRIADLDAFVAAHSVHGGRDE